MSDRRNSKSRVRRKFDSLCLLTVFVGGCGPVLTDPSAIDISGQWVSTDTIGPISAIQMTVDQRPDGTLSGQWSGKSSIANPACPPMLGLNPTNTLSGKNTVLEVAFELLGAGFFEGQATESGRLQGSFVSCGHIYPIAFSLAGPSE